MNEISQCMPANMNVQVAKQKVRRQAEGGLDFLGLILNERCDVCVLLNRPEKCWTLLQNPTPNRCTLKSPTKLVPTTDGLTC